MRNHSLRGRHLKGKGKGVLGKRVLGARETRGGVVSRPNSLPLPFRTPATQAREIIASRSPSNLMGSCCKLFFLSPAHRFRVSSRVPLARLLFTISPNWRACSQAKITSVTRANSLRGPSSLSPTPYPFRRLLSRLRANCQVFCRFVPGVFRCFLVLVKANFQYFAHLSRAVLYQCP